MKQRILIGVSVLAIALALFFIYRRLHPQPVLSFDVYFGDAVYQKTAPLAQEKKKVVVWCARLRIPMPELDAIIKEYRRTAKRDGHISIIAEERDPFEPNKGFGELFNYVSSATRVRELLAKYPQADLIVMFNGDPDFTGIDLAQLPNPHPKFFVVQYQELTLDKSQFANPLFAGAIVPSQVLPTGPLKTDAEKFDAYYKFVMPE